MTTITDERLDAMRALPEGKQLSYGDWKHKGDDLIVNRTFACTTDEMRAIAEELTALREDYRQLASHHNQKCTCPTITDERLDAMRALPDQLRGCQRGETC